MVTSDGVVIRAPVDRVLDLAMDVERWPDILAHYRWVRFLERRNGGGTVEMAAWRPFGPVRYPTWGVSELRRSGSNILARFPPALEGDAARRRRACRRTLLRRARRGRRGAR